MYFGIVVNDVDTCWSLSETVIMFSVESVGKIISETLETLIDPAKSVRIVYMLLKVCGVMLDSTTKQNTKYT